MTSVSIKPFFYHKNYVLKQVKMIKGEMSMRHILKDTILFM